MKKKYVTMIFTFIVIFSVIPTLLFAVDCTSINTLVKIYNKNKAEANNFVGKPICGTGVVKTLDNGHGQLVIKVVLKNEKNENVVYSVRMKTPSETSISEGDKIDFRGNLKSISTRVIHFWSFIIIYLE